MSRRIIFCYFVVVIFKLYLMIYCENALTSVGHPSRLSMGSYNNVWKLKIVYTPGIDYIGDRLFSVHSVDDKIDYKDEKNSSFRQFSFGITCCDDDETASSLSCLQHLTHFMTMIRLCIWVIFTKPNVLACNARVKLIFVF